MGCSYLNEIQMVLQQIMQITQIILFNLPNPFNLLLSFF